MKKILSLIDLISIWTGRVVAVLSVLVAVFIVYEIAMREGLNLPTVWVAEATIFGCALLYLLGGAWTLQSDHHVRVDMLYSKLKPKTKALIDCLTYFAFALYLVVMIWATYHYTAQSVSLRETTMSPWDPPIYPIKVAMFISLVLVFLQGTAKFIRDFHFFVKGRQL